MKRLPLLTLLALAGAALAACGGGRTSSPRARESATSTTVTTSTTTTTVPTPTVPTPNTLPAPPPPTPAAEPSPHFDTPEEAMAYLAEAWNNEDLVDLKHVTTPDARTALESMREIATNLRLDHCDANPAGDYMCYFDHDHPAGHSTPHLDHGEAAFLVGPADTPGWYMTVLQYCG